jgi:hypothetical protein
VFGVLLRLVLVEKSDDLAHHCLNRLGLIAYRLGDGNNPHTMFGELAEVEFLLEGLSEEAAVAVHDNGIDGMLAIACAFDHLLKHRSPVIAC